jgi:imidazolonepropionase-like amidohydrolase
LSTLTAAVAILAALAASATEPESAITVLRCGHVLDVRSGTLLPNQHIVVSGNRIAAMGPAASVEIPLGARVVDLTRAVVLPGLFDVHTHLMDTEDDTADIAYGLKKSAAEMTIQGIANARATLRAGFTSVRDVGPRRAFIDVALRNAIARGELPGPRMQAAGAYVTVSGGAGDVTGLAGDIELPRELRFGVADGPDQVRQRVREIIRHGADVIKVLATGAVLTLGSQPGAQEFTYDELRAAVEEAGKAGLRVACHAHGAAGAKDAIRAGVASIEHGSLLDDEALELMKQRGTFYVPTTYVHEVIMAGAGRGYPSEYIEKERVAGESEVKVFRRAVELGVRIAYGTDAAIFPHGENARQFALYVEHGMSPLEAIRSATLNAAQLMGWSDRLGSLEPGKLADVIAVRANPLEDVRTLASVVFVMKDGVMFRNDTP